MFSVYKYLIYTFICPGHDYACVCNGDYWSRSLVFKIFSQELLLLNPRPLADCQWTDVTAVDRDGSSSVGSGLARPRALVKPSAVTVHDRRHYKRNATYAEVWCARDIYYSRRTNECLKKKKNSPGHGEKTTKTLKIIIFFSSYRTLRTPRASWKSVPVVCGIGGGRTSSPARFAAASGPRCERPAGVSSARTPLASSHAPRRSTSSRSSRASPIRYTRQELFHKKKKPKTKSYHYEFNEL